MWNPALRFKNSHGWSKREKTWLWLKLVWIESEGFVDHTTVGTNRSRCSASGPAQLVLRECSWPGLLRLHVSPEFCTVGFQGFRWLFPLLILIFWNHPWLRNKNKWEALKTVSVEGLEVFILEKIRFRGDNLTILVFERPTWNIIGFCLLN